MLTLNVDPEVQAVASYMQQHIQAARLVSVAQAVARLAPSLWGNYEPETCEPLRLVAEPPSSERTPPVANG